MRIKSVWRQQRPWKYNVDKLLPYFDRGSIDLSWILFISNQYFAKEKKKSDYGCKIIYIWVLIKPLCKRKDLHQEAAHILSTLQENKRETFVWESIKTFSGDAEWSLKIKSTIFDDDAFSFTFLRNHLFMKDSIIHWKRRTDGRDIDIRWQKAFGQ